MDGPRLVAARPQGGWGKKRKKMWRGGSYGRARTRTRTLTQEKITHIHTHTHAITLICSLIHSHSLAHTRIHTRARALMYCTCVYKFRLVTFLIEFIINSYSLSTYEATGSFASIIVLSLVVYIHFPQTNPAHKRASE